eukprot:20618_1
MTSPKEYKAVDTTLTKRIDLQPNNESDSQEEPIPETNVDLTQPKDSHDIVHTTEDVELVNMADDDDRTDLQLQVMQAQNGDNNGVNGDDTKNKENTNDNQDDTDWPQFNPMSFCYPFHVYSKDWKQVKNEFLAGLIVAFAQIPETVAYAFLAGVSPIEGLQATWIVGFITAFFGGRPTMISGATGAIAAVQATLPYKNWIYPVVILSGILITLCGVFKLTKFARLIPHSAMIGFLNGLAIIIAESQLHIFYHAHNALEVVLMAGSSIIVFLLVYLLPRFTKMIPSSLAGILVAVLLEYAIFRAAFGIETVVIGDLGELSGDMPGLLFYRKDIMPIEFNMEIFIDMLIPSFWITLVAISEDVMTIDVVSEMTNTRPKTEEGERHMVRQQIIAMGMSNVICGLLGTMGGGSTIGASIIACFQGSNGRYRITGVVTALTVLFIVLVGHAGISAIPASALVGIIACTVHHTFEYHSIFIICSSFLPSTARNWIQKHIWKNSMRKIQRADAFVIVLVTFLTLISNLGIAITAGLIFSCLVYTWESAGHLSVYTEFITIRDDEENSTKEKEMKIYHLEGPLFFGNARSVVSEFTPKQDPHEVEIHLRDAQIYDYSAINALNTIAEKYKTKGKAVHLRHISDRSQKLITKAHHLVPHFTYDTIATVSNQGKFSLATPHHYHVAQYPK